MSWNLYNNLIQNWKTMLKKNLIAYSSIYTPKKISSIPCMFHCVLAQLSIVNEKRRMFVHAIKKIEYFLFRYYIQDLFENLGDSTNRTLNVSSEVRNSCFLPFPWKVLHFSSSNVLHSLRIVTIFLWNVSKNSITDDITLIPHLF